MNDVQILEPDDILATPRLYRRRSRPASLESELAAHRELAALMAADPREAIQRFLDLAVELCPAAGSAGLSELIEPPNAAAFFEWTAMSGAFAKYVGGSTPRDHSPCGLCLDQHHTILVERPSRVFTYFNEAQPEIIEGLIVPLYDTGKRPIGTLWVTSHEECKKFDPTDARIMEQFAVQLVLAIKLRRKAQILVELEQSARDKEILVYEVRHRVKNMIQMTSALLQVQETGAQSSEAKVALRDAHSRLLVLANVYDSLLQPGADVRHVDAAALVNAIAMAVRDASPRASQVQVRVECDELMLDVVDAVPLGLIVNEVITNAMKHAFSSDESGGEIAIELQSDGVQCLLEIRDNGAGIDAEPRAGSLGMRLMRSLARQLDAELLIDGSDGTSVKLIWNSKEPTEIAGAPEGEELLVR